MSFASMPLYFIENRGQTDGRAAYYIRGKDKTIYFTPDGLAFSLARVEREKPGLLVRASYDAGASERWLLKLDFINANPVAPVGAEPTPAIVSYFKGPKDEWKTALKTYAKLVYPDLWPGIDLVYSGTSNRLKYEFVVKPGADPRQVRLAYRGASSLKLDASGSLEIATPVGLFHDDRPYAYQEIDGRRVEVPMAYRLAADGSGSYGFQLGKYNSGQALILDPAIVIYSGFIGGIGDDRANGIAVDGDGNAYVTGETASDETTFPDTSGAFDRTQNGGVDIFVVKVKPDGKGLVYATFIGGDGDDRGLAIALEQGCSPPCAAYITGDTDSDENNFPVTSGAFQDTRQGGTDAFVAKIKDDGSDLLFLTYFGGSGDETGKGIAVDGAGNVFITGETKSTEHSSPNPFPVTAGDLDTQGGSGNFDAFVAKITGLDGGTREFAGFIGGSGDDRGNAIALDPGCSDPCDVYIAGETSSGESSFPATVGPDLTHNNGIDGFVAKIAGDGSGLIYAGYIGGGDTDRANGIAVDSAHKAYVAGETKSGEGSFPDGNGFGSVDGVDQTQNGGFDAFVVRVKDDGSGLEYATYIGGSGDDRANAIAIAPTCVSPCRAFIAGETDSDQLTFPDKSGPDVTFNGGIDGFLAVLETDGQSLVSAGFIGGSADDRAHAIAVDGTGGAFVAGDTDAVVAPAAKFPTKNGPDTSQNGGLDAFVTKICTTGCLDLTIKMTTTTKSALPGDNIVYSLTVTNKGPEAATGVVVDAVLPATSAFVTGSPGCSLVVATVECTVGGLAKGVSVILSITITAPTVTGQMIFTATVSSDQTDTNPSSDSSTVKTKVLLPDLVVKKISLDVVTVTVGGTINVTDTTSNKQSVPFSPATTAPSTTAFYLSTDKVLGGDVVLNSRAVPGLTAKGTSTATTALTIPALTSIGTYYIIAVADDGNAIDEGGNEGNNAKPSKKITVTP
ncbi:MAG TPA: SBBP repeat-containing protein [Verrucomicrobiae bacterium]|nr:SBBP repeat-containing protein [Verrucomicrobiae bacterium]